MLADDGRPPLMKTRLRMQENGCVETFYYNSNELVYSDDEEECPSSDRGGRRRPRCAFPAAGYCRHSSGAVTSPTQAISIETANDAEENGSGSSSNMEEDGDEWEDSLDGSMYFVNNESTLLEFSVEELVNPTASSQHTAAAAAESGKTRLSLLHFPTRSCRTVH